MWVLSLLITISVVVGRSSPSIRPNTCSGQSKFECQRLTTLSTTTASFLNIRGGSAASALDYRYFLAGGTCAAISHGITTPVDVVKTLMQSDDELKQLSVMGATRKIVAKSGIGILLTGLGATVMGYGVEGAMKFGIYEVLKPVTMQFIDSKAISYMVASIMAGAVAAVLLCPAESARIRLVNDPAFGNGTFDTLARLIREDGFAELFSGLWAMLAKQVPYTMTKQVAFDLFAIMFYKLAGQIGWGDLPSTKVLVSFGSAACAAVLACFSSQPGDMILTQTYKNKTPKKFINVIKEIKASSPGLSGFFVGTQARLVHVGIIITSQLMIYDVVKQAVGLKATGAH